jgi:hypothetical protein
MKSDTVQNIQMALRNEGLSDWDIESFWESSVEIRVWKKTADYSEFRWIHPNESDPWMDDLDDWELDKI